MPLCPRCGAAHQHDDGVCRECGKRLLTRPQVAADQTSLSFPTCVDGPVGCEGPAVVRSDGRLRCSAHDLSDHLIVQRIPDPIPLACFDGPAECHGVITLRHDGQLRCAHHQAVMDQPKWRGLFKRWFGGKR